MENKKVDFSSYFENDLFNQADVDLVEEKMENNLAILLESKEYIEINKKFHEMTLKLDSSLTSKQRKLLTEYQGLELEITTYQNCLAYYLGCKATIENDKLK